MATKEEQAYTLLQDWLDQARAVMENNAMDVADLKHELDCRFEGEDVADIRDSDEP